MIGWGKVIEYELAQLKRSFSRATIEEFGLALQESKNILRQLQVAMVESQMPEFNAPVALYGSLCHPPDQGERAGHQALPSHSSA
ncbi:hypothetical protein [Beijerinckia mobilis]|uniref:hypothetical protein n=1 Tax=Beijerinckia mobilis TaxID=231434 RepID=UPI0005558025|nr:hypothetical protein [Beijerinckia mobilis]